MKRLLTLNLAWLIGIISVGTMLGIVVITAAYPFARRNEGGAPNWLETLIFTPPLLAFALVGLVLSLRRPRHPIGWLFSIAGACFGLGYFSDLYFWLASVQAPGALPINSWLAWAGTHQFLLGFEALLIGLMLFPDGRLLSRRWIVLLVMIVAGFTINFLAYAFQPGPLGYGIENPAGSTALHAYSNLFEAISNVGFVLSFIGILIAVALRFRRSRGVERLQIKWFLFATTMAAVGFIVAGFLIDYPILNGIAWITGFISLGMTPVVVGIAVLRYRLFEIDVIIRRTLVYGLLTVILALIYFGGVIIFQRIFGLITGQAGQSPAAIVISTLAIAALFNPLRKRIQEGIDRRFYRKKYDAQKTVEAFAVTLRDEVDLERLSEHLLAVVQETVQPESVSLWLREPRRASFRQE